MLSLYERIFVIKKRVIILIVATKMAERKNRLKGLHFLNNAFGIFLVFKDLKAVVTHK